VSDEAKIEVSKKDLEFLLDQTRAFSGTYEGGTIDKNEADILRRVAELLGFDPIEYTPLSFTHEYHHEPEIQGYSRMRPDGTWYSHGLCKHCYKEEDHEVHRRDDGQGSSTSRDS